MALGQFNFHLIRTNTSNITYVYAVFLLFFTSLLCNSIIILVFHTFIDFHIFIEFAMIVRICMETAYRESVIGGFKEISYVEEGNGSIYIDTVKRVYPDQFSTLVIRYNHHHLITKIVISLTRLNVPRA